MPLSESEVQLRAEGLSTRTINALTAFFADRPIDPGQAARVGPAWLRRHGVSRVTFGEISRWTIKHGFVMAAEVPDKWPLHLGAYDTVARLDEIDAAQ